MTNNRLSFLWRKRLRRLFSTIMVAGVCLLPLQSACSKEITVFAASLSIVLTEIGTNFQAQTGDHVVFNYGGSSPLPA